MLFNKNTSKLIDSGYPIYEMENGVVTIDNTAEIILYYAFKPEYEAVVLVYAPVIGMKIHNYKGASTQEVVHLNGTDEFKAQVILRNTKVSTWISKIDYFEYNDTLIYIYNGVKEIIYTDVLPEDGLELIISKENSSNAIGYKLVNPVYTFVITRGYVIVIFANSDDPSSTAKPTTPHSVPTTAQAASTTTIFESTTSALYRCGQIMEAPIN
ncbi:hypothetical protein WR25_15753 [Diploscapter pachys]|uniref:Uncharacterized protein n=1 Tax=Diploscapter pachys TaxID=2018661 RepID=A0A2A2J532_9BILA|nr:hypothetical protein WR25_15753 [Diploscapter pachys]